MEEKEIEEHKKKIDGMSQTEMARLWRFAPSGHVYFGVELGKYFDVRFRKLGGFSASISKELGW